MSFATEFKEFAVKGNAMDLAVGVIIGAAFGKIVDSIVKDLIMPVVGAVFGGFDFSNLYIALDTVPEGVATTLDAVERSRRAGAGLRQLRDHPDQLHHSGLHRLHAGQADQPAEEGSARLPPAAPRRKTWCCCARFGTA